MLTNYELSWNPSSGTGDVSGASAWNVGGENEFDTARQDRKDRPQRCAAAADADDERSLSATLGTECGKSRCASTAGAPESAATNTQTDDESATGSSDERRQPLEITTVERTGASGIGETRVGSLG